MADPFTGEVRIFAYNFAPINWAFCDGQLLPIAQFQQLYDVIGTTYGGNGSTSFALPDLQGRAPMHPDQGPGLSPHTLGEAGGAEQVALTNGEMPVHRHGIQTVATPGTTSTPGTTVVLAAPVSGSAYKATGTLAAMGTPLNSTGGGAAHNNMQPYLILNFYIALIGVHPQPE